MKAPFLDLRTSNNEIQAELNDAINLESFSAFLDFEHSQKANSNRIP